MSSSFTRAEVIREARRRGYSRVHTLAGFVPLEDGIPKARGLRFGLRPGRLAIIPLHADASMRLEERWLAG